MAYAAYDSSSPNPPVLDGSQPIAGPRTWHYWSSHTDATVSASSHITDGRALGMVQGDRLVNYYIIDTTVGEWGAKSTASKIVTNHIVTAVGATYVNLSTGTAVSSST